MNTKDVAGMAAAFARTRKDEKRIDGIRSKWDNEGFTTASEDSPKVMMLHTLSELNKLLKKSEVCGQEVRWLLLVTITYYNTLQWINIQFGDLILELDAIDSATLEEDKSPKEVSSENIEKLKLIFESMKSFYRMVFHEPDTEQKRE